MGDEDSIMGYNGGSVLAMSGKNCVAIACDTRFGVRNLTVATNFPKVFKMTDTCLIGISGLTTDMQTLYRKLRFHTNMYKLREEREISPKVFSAMTANMLYAQRFGPLFVEPVIVGLEGDKPFMCGLDLIGAPVYAEDFVCAGTAVDAMFGTCESFWKPDMTPDELFETISQCLLSALDRDAMSGWGAVVHVITADGVTSKSLKGRQD
eukprot:TRINITY_DN6907_c0_g1_i6.p4 TRINITY_DN6907_c0_g1~~TRINITY_DN6907_c0_g1_i6.p4  ORF type:complete len:237 (+),score=48.25 TRINITY_DN6907_c0_g1_i6:90-713(+)